MCSACSGDPEDPPAAQAVHAPEEDSPFWAWWKEVEEEDLEEGPTAVVNRRAPDPGKVQGID